MKYSQVHYTVCLDKKAPTFASCSFDRHALIDNFLQTASAHLKKNDVPIRLSSSLQIQLHYLHLNSSVGNDKFVNNGVEQGQSSDQKFVRTVKEDITRPKPVDFRIWGLMHGTCVQDSCP